jgi:ubiquinone/menaquinone biosynthesis C-methylase UbiE
MNAESPECRKRVVAQASNTFAGHDRVLDLGCGPGKVAIV